MSQLDVSMLGLYQNLSDFRISWRIELVGAVESREKISFTP